MPWGNAIPWAEPSLLRWFPPLLLSLLLPVELILFVAFALCQSCVFQGLAVFLEELSAGAWRHPCTSRAAAAGQAAAAGRGQPRGSELPGEPGEAPSP